MIACFIHTLLLLFMSSAIPRFHIMCQMCCLR